MVIWVFLAVSWFYTVYLFFYLYYTYYTMQVRINIPSIYGPKDWREKQSECFKRAKLLGNATIIFSNDNKYCTVKEL